LKEVTLMSNIPEIKCTIKKLSHEGRGIAYVNDKITFVENALPNEEVCIQYLKQNSKYNDAIATKIIKANKNRIPAKCIYYNNCGGCSLQHMSSESQLQVKQQALVEMLSNQSVEPESWLKPITGNPWSYRARARLHTAYSAVNDKVSIGFHGKDPNKITNILSCDVMQLNINAMLPSINTLVNQLSIKQHVKQIKITHGDNITALVIKHNNRFSAEDQVKLRQFSESSNTLIYLEKNSRTRLIPSAINENTMEYHLNDYDLTIQFHPNNFSQINHDINQKMIGKSIELLDLKPTDSVLDLFCGIGNFSLPIAQFAKNVTGVEADAESVISARHNAKSNHISNAKFITRNLFANRLDLLNQSKFSKILLDPPRAGAKTIINKIQAWEPERVIYISCNPATLARDSLIMKNAGFTLKTAGIIDMFPHTKHIEAIALFCRH
jgi:23S rRNA (uracil1939-C5)-methyltransferase